MGANRDSMAHQAFSADRRAKAMRLYLKGGTTWREIAEQLDYADKAAAYKDVQRGLERSRQELGELGNLMRTAEGLRLNAIAAALWDAATSGDVKAAEAYRRNRESFRRLYGLDAAVVHHVLTIDAVDAEIARLEAELRARGQDPPAELTGMVEDDGRGPGAAGPPALPA
jgi:transposase-like protein